MWNLALFKNMVHRWDISECLRARKQLYYVSIIKGQLVVLVIFVLLKTKTRREYTIIISVITRPIPNYHLRL